jgi:hypothetical protein
MQSLLETQKLLTILCVSVIRGQRDSNEKLVTVLMEMKEASQVAVTLVEAIILKPLARSLLQLPLMQSAQ